MQVVIFDFDETIIIPRKPTKQNMEYIRKKFQLKKRLDKWWDSPFSLAFDYSLKCVKGYSFLERYNYYKQNGYKMILLTSRIITLEKEIKSLLDSHNISFDEYYLREVDCGSLEHKFNQLKSIVESNHTLDISIYDDSSEVIDHVNSNYPFVKTFLVPIE